MKQKANSRIGWLSARFIAIKDKFSQFVQTRPLISFFGLLTLLLILIIIGNFLRSPKITKDQTTVEPRLVDTYQPGQGPTLESSATIDKSGVVTIVAQTPGIVGRVNVTEGKAVVKGANLIWLSNSYAGGNSASLSRQIAQKNAEFSDTTFPLQIDLINKQRELAEKGNDQANELRDINEKTIDETKNLISLYEEIVTSLDAQITSLTNTNVGGSNDSAILAAKQGKAGALAGLNGLKATLRNTQYLASDDQEPGQMSNISKDLTIRQLELQAKSLVLARELAQLNLKLARLGESVFYPVTPVTGVIERVFVKPGDSVNPGTPLAVVKATQTTADAVVTLPVDIARNISRVENTIFHVNDQKFEVLPRYISSEPTDGNLASISFTLPDTLSKLTNNGQILKVTLPVGVRQVSIAEFSIPLDAVYQTSDQAWVYVIFKEQDNIFRAQAKTVELGATTGSFVKIITGLTATDEIIVTRGITDDQLVRTQ